MRKVNPWTRLPRPNEREANEGHKSDDVSVVAAGRPPLLPRAVRALAWIMAYPIACSLN